MVIVRYTGLRDIRSARTPHARDGHKNNGAITWGPAHGATGYPSPRTHNATRASIPPHRQCAIRDTDWQFVTNTHIPMLSSPSQAISLATLADYLYNRDDSRHTRGAPGAGAIHQSLAAQALTLSHRGITKRGAKVLHLWDLRWHGENQAVAAADPTTITSHCTLCGHQI